MLQKAATVGAGSAYGRGGDVYSPCALDAVLNPRTIPVIRASVIAGAANNQLSDPRQDARLQERGITYCPDYVVNAGGVLSVGERGKRFDRSNALKRVERGPADDDEGTELGACRRFADRSRCRPSSRTPASAQDQDSSVIAER
ncbi:hypothetical protein [Sphingomonas albertensis]|uniref:Glutamate/phenylalanine/leucine/valine/L-tryptophan dehydrogenase C-terminal domain-containing protein n=2 Tax=Sphingomonas albertensis TaxID=2762591 RepID=A0ABR7AKV1_9SPHN|nr:hypothetical protein [Sphingomonas albertensis]